MKHVVIAGGRASCKGPLPHPTYMMKPDSLYRHLSRTVDLRLISDSKSDNWVIFEYKGARLKLGMISERRDPVGWHIGKDGKPRRTFIADPLAFLRWLQVVSDNELSTPNLISITHESRDKEYTRRLNYRYDRRDAASSEINARRIMGRKVHPELWKRWGKLDYPTFK